MSRTEEQQKYAITLFASYKAEIDKRELSNTDNYDKSILTLSSAGLAISLTLIKDIMPTGYTSYLFLLYIGWGCFGLSIAITIISFLISNEALKYQLVAAEKYYIEGMEDAYTRPNPWLTATMWLNRMSGLLFILAIISVITFGIFNFSKRNTMNEDKNSVSVSNEETVLSMEGQSVPHMQKVLIGNGANVPQMQSIPTQSTVPPTTTSSTPIQPSSPISSDKGSGE